jgi:hypothetical protein
MAIDGLDCANAGTDAAMFVDAIVVLNTNIVVLNTNRTKSEQACDKRLCFLSLKLAWRIVLNLARSDKKGKGGVDIMLSLL